MKCLRHILPLLSLVLLLFLVACGGDEKILTGVSEEDANQVVAVLLNVGIDAQKVPLGDGAKADVTVPKDKMAAALVILRNSGVPKTHYAQFKDIFTGDSFTSSPTEEKARYVYLLSQSIEDTLGAIEGVVSARVHVVLPQKPTFLDPSVPATASVLLRYAPASNLAIIVPDIKRLVANSVPGLVAEKVSVLLVEAAGFNTHYQSLIGTENERNQGHASIVPPDHPSVDKNAPLVLNQPDKTINNEAMTPPHIMGIPTITIVIVAIATGVIIVAALGMGLIFFLKKKKIPLMKGK